MRALSAIGVSALLGAGLLATPSAGAVGRAAFPAELLSAAGEGRREADGIRATGREGLGPLLTRAIALQGGAASGPAARAPAVGATPPIEMLVDAVSRARAEVAAAARGGGIVRLSDAFPVLRPGEAHRPPTGLPVDAKRVARAAIPLAAAIDAAVPRLAASQVSTSSKTSAECDVLDQLPVLCVGGVGPNEHTKDASLTIDLGGPDVYRNSAGAANANLCGLGTIDPARPWCQVSVVVDLGGDDVYASPADERRDSAGQVAVVGAGLAGIGILLDVEGDDLYTPTAEPLPTLFGQGGGAFGVGALVDLSGNDRYILTGNTSGGSNPFGGGPGITGQGAGGVGIGVLHDAGGNDAYEARIGPAVGPTVSVFAQGYGLIGGVGLLLDGGGNDDLSIHAEETPPDAPGEMIPITIAHGQAYSGLGAGMLLTGRGDTTYRVEAASGSGAASVQVQGINYNTGLSVLDDLDGNDRYDVRAHAALAREVIVAEGCGCESADARLPTRAAISIWGQGFAIPLVTSGSSIALLSDRGGDDRYEMRSSLSMRAVARDLRPNGAATAAAGEGFEAFPASTHVSGQGEGVYSPGILLDGGGDDAYVTEASSRATAIAEALPGRPVEVSALSPRAIVDGMGGGVHGGLLDRGGRDSYEASARARSETVPAGGGRDLSSSAVVLGAFGGSHVDVDAGELDTYLVDPERGIAAGERGEGPAWGDAGAAANASTAPKQVTAVRILEVVLDGPKRLLVDAVLESEGASLPGRELVLEIEEQGPLAAYPLEGAGHAIIDAGGRARLVLDLDFALRHHIAANPYRAVVRYSGDEHERWSRADATFAGPVDYSTAT